MQLPAPARECSDAELQRVYDFYARRAVQPLEPVDYSLHTSECAPDDDDGPAGDLRSMGGLVLGLFLLSVAIVGLFALVAVM